MSLPTNVLRSQSRILASIGIPIPMPESPRLHPWHKLKRRLMAPLALVTSDMLEIAIEAIGFGLLMVLFLLTMYVTLN